MMAPMIGMLAAVAFGILELTAAAPQGPAGPGMRRLEPAVEIQTGVEPGGRPGVGDPEVHGLIAGETEDPFGHDLDRVALIQETPEEPGLFGEGLFRAAAYAGILLIPLAALIALIAVSRRASRRAEARGHGFPQEP